MDLQAVFRRQIQPKINYFEECWVFTGSTKNGTHGNVRVGGRGGSTMYTHRIAFEVFVRPLQPGEVVMHRCNTPKCCNPAHLEVGTQADNMKYAYATGAVGKQNFEPGSSGVIGVKPSTVSGYKYWVAYTDSKSGVKRSNLYHGKDHFEAVCARKSYELRA